MTATGSRQSNEAKGLPEREVKSFTNNRDLRAKLVSLQESCPEALSDFLAFQEGEKEKVERITRGLSVKRKNDILESWEQEEKRLELFERWLSLPSKSGHRGVPGKFERV